MQERIRRLHSINFLLPLHQEALAGGPTLLGSSHILGVGPTYNGQLRALSPTKSETTRGGRSRTSSGAFPSPFESLKRKDEIRMVIAGLLIQGYDMRTLVRRVESTVSSIKEPDWYRRGRWSFPSQGRIAWVGGDWTKLKREISAASLCHRLVPSKNSW